MHSGKSTRWKWWHSEVRIRRGKNGEIVLRSTPTTFSTVLQCKAILLTLLLKTWLLHFSNICNFHSVRGHTKCHLNTSTFAVNKDSLAFLTCIFKHGVWLCGGRWEVFISFQMVAKGNYSQVKTSVSEAGLRVLFSFSLLFYYLANFNDENWKAWLGTKAACDDRWWALPPKKSECLR